MTSLVFGTKYHHQKIRTTVLARKIPENCFKVLKSEVATIFNSFTVLRFLIFKMGIILIAIQYYL